MSAAIVALGATVVGGVVSSRNAKKNRQAQQRMNDGQMGLMQEQLARWDRFLAALPGQSRNMISNLNASFSEVELLLSQAKKNQDEKAIQLYQAQRDLVKSHLDAELKAIGANTQEVFGIIDEVNANAVKLINEDADVNELLQDKYTEETKDVIPNLRKMGEISEQRIDSILENGGLTDEAVTQLSRTKQGVADLTRRTKNIEARVGKGGSASRVTATELEGLKVIGDVTAGLTEASGRELRAEQGNLSNTQNLVLGASGERLSRQERRRGRETLAATQPLDAARINVAQNASNANLNAINNANVETRNLTGAEGESSLAREDQFARDRASLVQGKTAAIQAVNEREQDLTSGAISQKGGASKSMADIMGVMANNFANMAAKSDAQASKFFGTAVKATAGGFAARNAGNSFGAGALQGGFGIDTGAFKSTGNNIVPVANNANQEQLPFFTTNDFSPK